MEKISLYIKIVSLVSILAGVMISLIPGGRLKGAYTSLCAVILLCSLVMPFSEFESDKYGIHFPNEEEISESVGAEIFKAEELIYQETVSQAIVNKLSAEGINISAQIITAYKDEYLKVTEVIITGNVSEKEKKYISEFVSDSFKEAVTVFKEDESD